MAQQPQVNVTVSRDGPAPANPAHARARERGDGHAAQPHAAPPPPTPPPAEAPPSAPYETPEEAPRVAPPRTGPPRIEIRLRRPMQAHDGVREVLILREPTVLDIERFGIPMSMEFGQGAKPVFDTSKMTGLLAQLGNCTDREIRAMDPRDYVSACWSLAPFFVPDFQIVSS
jgi:Phage tail assembly chaperone proteins, E, or 41 or 14